MNIDIHAITVCVNYSHLLKYTIIANRHFFKRWIIVTHETDLDTIKLCKKHNLEYIFSKSLYNRTFFKGGAINEAIDYLGGVDWILHIDADVVLPQNFPDVFKEDESGKPLIRGTYLNWPEGKGKLYTTHKFRRYVKNSIQEPVLYCMGRVNVDEGEDLDKPARIYISTIHAAKGGEEDNVILCLDMGRKIIKSIKESEEYSDEENRVWYVGITRAKNNLYKLKAKINRQGYKL